MNRYDVIKIMDRMTDSLTENVNKTIKSNPRNFSEMIIYLDLLDSWVKETEELDANIVLKEVCYDLIAALFIAANGMYRSAYISLRSALELGLSFVYFIDNNYNFMLWKKNQYDMKWAILKNENYGVVSKKYLSIFDTKTDLDKLIDITQSTYRECSEYVHGKYSYMHTKINEQKISYDKENFDGCCKMFLKVIKVIIVYIGIRFQKNIKNLEKEKKIIMDEVLKELKVLKSRCA